MKYDELAAELDRIEAEAGCELPAISEPTLRDRAQRLLECDDPPTGEDRDFCYRLIGGNAITD
jgi:hypothetical protein